MGLLKFICGYIPTYFLVNIILKKSSTDRKIKCRHKRIIFWVELVVWLTLDNVLGKNSMISLVCGIIIGLTDAILE